MMNGSDLTVELRFIDADALLALAEWALNHPDLDLGPGLHRRNAEEAARRIESQAAMARRGFNAR
jgi:hypothetical protein